MELTVVMGISDYGKYAQFGSIFANLVGPHRRYKDRNTEKVNLTIHRRLVTVEVYQQMVTFNHQNSLFLSSNNESCSFKSETVE